ncbi:TPA: NAD(P)-binding domain-containing protein [Stenotrophomonas maltophilia]|uniref:flavin-containing monooxygenase n=1 Tax=Stenotrophomonas maltophilia TaxID=40324 RepID=UPI0015DEB008|nr:NAD(P)-binding domain-containing protein [Stenotrophomonas maltophilia]MBA0446826.1 pyridine nucleotide-disulfide oxidoreductase [Stenotrophomonas maltophilia]HEL2977967.1 NAD(P)-binding domain-containing protein [Stenotrophomonas maltophilia]
MPRIEALHGSTLVISPDSSALPAWRPPGPLPHRVPLVIIGAGQAGLSLSAVLQEAGVEHRVLESETVGSSWRRRWDSFQTNTANATMALHGHPYAGEDPDGFMGAPEVIERLRGYARERSLPVHEGCAVHRVSAGPDGYIIDSAQGPTHACALVVATGEYRRARMPRVPFAPPPGIAVLHSGDYRNPRQLPEGGVLVIGGGQSGAQIAQDLNDSGRSVYWSLAKRHSHTRRLRGKDSMTWWDMAGRIHQHVGQTAGVLAGEPDALRKARTAEFPLISGKGNAGRGSSISLLAMHRDGIRLLGRLQDLDGFVARFADVRPQLQAAIEATRVEYAYLDSLASAYYATRPEPRTDDARYIPEEVYLHWEPEPSPCELDLQGAGIRSVVLATGFVAEWPWLDVQGALDAHGYPLGQFGVSPQPGLFFIGMHNLQRMSSSFLCNGGRDARDLLPAILRHLGQSGRTGSGAE